jgi:quercetin dioxygenase-like cupin family protein
MKHLIPLTLLCCSSAVISVTAAPQQQPKAEPEMEVISAGSQTSIPGPEKIFSGNAMIDPLYLPKDPKGKEISAASVTFEPCARSAWHTHPKGQLLIVTAGKGWVQQQGHAKQTINAGDVIWTPPGVMHWHGATDKASMTHIAVQPYSADGKNVVWLEKVSDSEYFGK